MSVRAPGFMVVSFSCAGIISPRPLKREISTLPLPLNTVFSSSSRWLLVARIIGLAALAEAVERRHGEKQMAVRNQLRHLAIEEREQQRGDVRAIHIGVGHDDDALVAQRIVAVARAGAATKRLHQIGEFRDSAQLAGGGARDVQDLAAQREDGLGGAVARLLGGAAGGIAFDEKNLRAARRIARAIGELAGQAQFACRGFAGDFALLPPFQPIVRLIDDEIQQPVGFLRVLRQPMIEMIAHDVFDQPRGVRRGQLLFRLALEFRLADEDRTACRRPRPSRRPARSAMSCDCSCARHARAAPLVSALRKPCSCVPPCEVGMVLQ